VRVIASPSSSLVIFDPCDPLAADTSKQGNKSPLAVVAPVKLAAEEIVKLGINYSARIAIPLSHSITIESSQYQV
jgi:hypothetical protein